MAFGTPVCATSPRTAGLRCHALNMACLGSGHYEVVDDALADGSEFVAEACPVLAANDEMLRDGQAVYCEDCEMWLNGPTQREDHKIGKKHKHKKKTRN